MIQFTPRFRASRRIVRITAPAVLGLAVLVGAVGAASAQDGPSSAPVAESSTPAPGTDSETGTPAVEVGPGAAPGGDEAPTSTVPGDPVTTTAQSGGSVVDENVADLDAPQPLTAPAPVTGSEASPSNGAAPSSAAPAASDGASAQPSLPPIPAEALPHDLSPMGMYRQADVVVKSVMLGLIFASVVTWTILIVKLIEFAVAMASIRRGAGRIEEADSLRAALAHADGRGPDAGMLRAAARELNRSGPSLSGQGVQERISSRLSQIQARAARQMNRGTGVLATIGSTAPFVGLFGTVWGIMNSFIGISEAQTTNLAVVAPGIAEALLATALGLVAAIPAVVIYNIFARASGGYRLRLGEAASGVERLVSRDLDRRATGMAV